MKRLLTIFAIALAATLGSTTSAEAGRISIGYTTHYTHGHESCGCAKRYKKIFRGYDECGAPIWSHRRISTVHSCHSRRVHRGHGGYSYTQNYYPRHRRSGYYRNNYYNRGNSCNNGFSYSYRRN